MFMESLMREGWLLEKPANHYKVTTILFQELYWTDQK